MMIRHFKSESWWNPSIVEALIKDIVLTDLRRLRPGETAMGTDPQLDSLERLQVASTVATFFQMHHVGIEDNLLTTPQLDEWIEIVCASLEVHDRHIGFTTSGSTGEPTTHIHQVGCLEQEAAFWQTIIGSEHAVRGVVPRHHIYGFLFTVLLPRQLGVQYIDARQMIPGRLAASMGKNSVLVAYPNYWQLIARNSVRFPEGTIGVTSTAPCPEELAHHLTEKNISRLIQIYGSSETGGIGWRETPDTPYQLIPYWCVKDDMLELMRPGEMSLCVSLPDAVSWVKDRFFHLKGRKDSAVQVGGINVYPARISQKIEEMPEVLQARVRLMRPDEGERLKAFIVPADPNCDLRHLSELLKEYVNQALEGPARPRAFTFGHKLPTGELGKEIDWII